MAMSSTQNQLAATRPLGVLDPLDEALRERMLAALEVAQADNLAHIEPTNVVPTKPRAGDIRLADGVNWNPGAGAGFYGYRNGAWFLLG